MPTSNIATGKIALTIFVPKELKKQLPRVAINEETTPSPRRTDHPEPRADLYCIGFPYTRHLPPTPF